MKNWPNAFCAWNNSHWCCVITSVFAQRMALQGIRGSQINRFLPPLTAPRPPGKSRQTGFEHLCDANLNRLVNIVIFGFAFGRCHTCAMLWGTLWVLFSALDGVWKRCSLLSCRHLLLGGFQRTAGCVLKSKCLQDCSQGFAWSVLGRSWVALSTDHTKPQYFKLKRCFLTAFSVSGNARKTS